MEDQTAARAQDLRARALTYEFLSHALDDADLPAEFFSALAQNPPQTGTELDGWARSLEGVSPEEVEQARKDVAADHAATLLGMARRPVSPYESVHTSEGELLMQEARDRAVAAYRASGFSVAEGCRVPEDHIAIELSFMAALASRAAQELEDAADSRDGSAQQRAEKVIEAQAAFLEQSLLPWVPGFCDLLEARAKTGFYRGVAQMLRAFMEEERTWAVRSRQSWDVR